MLHFKWIDKHLLQRIIKMKPTELYSKCNSSIDKISNYINDNTNPLNMIRKLYTKICANFLPYDEQQLNQHQVISDYQELTTLTKPIGTLDENDRRIRLQITIASKNAEIRSKLNHIFTDKLNWTNILINHADNECLPELQHYIYDFIQKIKQNDQSIDQSDVICSLKNDIEIFKNYCDTFVENSSTFDPFIEILPIVEYLSLKSLNHLINKATTSDSKLNSLFFGWKSIDINAQTLIQLNCQNKNECYNACMELWTKIYPLIEIDYKNKSFENIEKILTNRFTGDFYRNFTSHQLKLLMNLQHLTMHCSLQSNICESSDKNQYILYNGPTLTNSILSTVFDENGKLRSYGLGDLGLFEMCLNQRSKLIWNNLEIMQPSFDVEKSNLLASQQSATTLLVEISYINSKIKNANEDIDLTSLIEMLKGKTSDSYTFCENLPKNIEYSSNLVKDQQHLHASMINSLCGAIQINLQIFLPLLDPIEKNRLKMEYVNQDLKHLTNLEAAYDFMKIAMNYKHLGEETLIPIRMQIEQFKTRSLRLSEKVALRPSVCLYKELTKDVEHFLRTCCQPKILHDLIKHIEWNLSKRYNDIMSNVNLYRQNINECLQRIDLWCNNATQFQYHTLKKYSLYYRDFITPIECAISILKYGLSGLRYNLIKSRDSIHSIDRDDVDKMLENLISFPCVNGLIVLPGKDANVNIENILKKLVEKADTTYLT